MGTAKFAGAVRELLADKLRAYAEKGMTGRVVRVMILGIPNVGKSTFINKVAGRKTAKTEDRPGVTRSKQWVPIDRNLELLDTPGILWPKFDDQSVGMNLAYTGAVKDDILDVETLGCHLMAYLGPTIPTPSPLATSCRSCRSGSRRRTTSPTATACWKRRERSGAS